MSCVCNHICAHKRKDVRPNRALSNLDLHELVHLRSHVSKQKVISTNASRESCLTFEDMLYGVVY